MILIRRFTGVFLLPILGAACTIERPQTHRDVPPGEFDRRFTPEELGADLDTMIQVFEEVHPNLYHHTPRERIEAARTETRASLDEPLTRVQFYPVAARLAARFEDGHTGVSRPGEEWTHFLNNGGQVFPFDVEWQEPALEVTRCYLEDSPLKPGDRIESINGVSSSAIFQQFLDEEAGGLPFQTASFKRRARSHLWVHEIHSPFTIECRSSEAGGVSTFTVEGITSAGLSDRQKVSASQPAAGKSGAYRFERLPGDIGYLEFTSMVDSAAFDRFLKTTFSEIKTRPVAGLIIDLRKNGGGDSRLGDNLLGYINVKPYKMADRKEWKVSRRYKEYMKAHIAAWARWMPLQLLHPMGRRYFGTPEGQVAVFSSDMENPGPNDVRYRGPVCFLIGPFTFSSAMMLANAVGDFDLATLIGEETGGIPNAFGEVYSFDLPNTRLSVGVSSARFVRANGEAEDLHGVRPDIEVRQTDEDRRRGIDTVLERAQVWVRKAGQSDLLTRAE